MSLRLAPFTLVLAYPPDPKQSSGLFRDVVRPIQRKMDLAANPVFKAFLAGSFSGTCSTILFQPLDLVKTRQQNLNASVNQPRNMFSIMGHVLRTEHVMGLWRGILPSITRTVPGVGIYFGSLHYLKNLALERGTEPTALEAIGLGMFARSVAGAIMIPITVLKTRFESGTYNYHRMSQALAQIYHREGIRGLCCGLVPTLVRDAPYSGLYLMFYTQLKQTTSTLDNAQLISPTTKHFSCGIVAGFLASLVTHPADVIKTRMQLDPVTYKSVHNAILSIFRDQGLKGFTVGLGPRMLRRTLMSALAWTVYEEIMKHVGLK